jgi:hypothetical protein
MNKVIFGIGIIAVGLFALAMPVAVAQGVYLMPQHCNATYGDELEVEIWINATNFKSGQINLTYDSGCVNATNYAANITNLPMSGWTHYDGREWLTFATSQQSLTGNYQIGTFTIRCVNADACGTRLCFAEPSALFDPQGNEFLTSWMDGALDCKPQADENMHDGDGTHADDTTISPDENETEPPAVNETQLPPSEPTQTPLPSPTQESDVTPTAAVPELTPTPVVQTPSSSSTQEQGSGLFGLVLAFIALVLAGVVIRGIRRHSK